MTSSRAHVALLGDSIFDNAAYTRGEPDVVTHLKALLPTGWTATLCAVDGATTAGLERQLSHVPGDATHLAIAVGGNDALGNMDLLSMRVSSSAEVLEAFADRTASFERAYREAIGKAMLLRRPILLCTIYNGALVPEVRVAARAGLTIFNDVILRTAIDLRLDALELRSICTEPADYANPIEPSGSGGLKIARAIARAVGAVDRSEAPARVWGDS